MTQYLGGKRSAKTFTFDRVYGQYSTQEQLFNEAVCGVCGAVRGRAVTVAAAPPPPAGPAHH